MKSLVSASVRALAYSGLLLLACSMVAFAQTGSIQGTVTDTAGAVVPGAEVTVTNVSSNAVRTVTSSETGAYSITNLAVGDYELTAKKESFKTYRVPKVNVTVAQALTVNVTFEPGVVSEEVQVQASQVGGIDLENAQVSNLVDQRKMSDLPLITRDPYQLILLSPGTIQTNSSLGGFSVNGTRERNNNFLLDGLDNNDTSVPGIASGLASLNPDATEEFRVITNNFLPEYGRNNGAIIDVVTKSGTNQLHGDAYWFGRYNALGARDYFNHNLDENGNMEPQNPYVRNQFGFSVGGPIVKNKTFFFVNNEWQRFRTTLTNVATVPTPGFKSGVFDYTDANGDTFPVDLTDPNSPNNAEQVPMSPFMQQILALYPDPNGGNLDALRGLYFYPSSSRQDVWNLTTKIDHHFTDREGISLRYAYDTYKDPNPFHDEFLPGLGAVASQSHIHNAAATLTSTLTSNLVNESKFGFNRADLPFTCGGLDTLNIGATDQYGRGRDFTVPGFDGFGCQVLGDADGQARRTGTWTVGDSLSWVKSSHTMKFGAEYRRVFENGADNFSSRDTVTFNSFTNFGVPWINIDPNNPCDPNNSDPTTNGCGSSTLQNMGSMLFGIMDTETQAQFFDKSGNQMSQDFRQFRQNEYGFYYQDSWKIRSNFTLDLGARYQFNGVPYEVNNNLSNLFADSTGPAPFTFTIVGPGTGHLLYNNDFSNFEPRIGFAWDPFKNAKTSVRGGFGIFHDRVFGNLFGNAKANPPFQATWFGLPIVDFPEPTPDNVPLPDTQPVSATVDDGAGIFPVLFPRNFPLPYNESWNFGVQQEIMRDMTIEVNYVGNRGLHELRTLDGNSPDPALVAANIADGTPPSLEQGANLWFGGPGIQAVQNNAFFQTATTYAIGSSYYDGLQANLTKRMGHGLQFQVAYTYSHSIDDSSDPLVAAEGNRSFPRNSRALYNERGNSDFDIRHRAVINYIYELPFGRGKTMLNSGVMGRILEGWQLSGITSFQTGHPFDIFYNVDVEHTGLTGRGTLVGNPALPSDHPETQTGPARSAFCVQDLGCSPPFGVPGNIGRNHFYGPSYQNWDMVMAKNTSLGERVKLETRFEFFNIFNHPQFDQPDNLLQDGDNFGFSTATIGRSDGTTGARQLQVALKLKF